MSTNQRISIGVKRSRPFTVTVDGTSISAYPGETVGTAMMAAGLKTCRHTPLRHEPRGIYCGIGICHDCLLTINGRPNALACKTFVLPDLDVQTQEGLGKYEARLLHQTGGGLTQKDVSLVVIGAGSAGIAATIAAAKAGASVLVIDENAKPGGQIDRQLPEAFTVDQLSALSPDYRDRQILLRQFEAYGHRIQTWNDAMVWSVFDDRQLAVMRGDAITLVNADKIIIATGAYDRPVPIPGWTLPGVMTLGGAQALIKTQRICPGQRVLLSGMGPLQWVVANQFLDAGAHVVAVVDATAHFALWRRASLLLQHINLPGKGRKYLRRLRAANVPILRSHRVTAVEGDGCTQIARVAKLDSRCTPRPGTERTFKVDTVCLGYGFEPRIGLTSLLGCEHRYDPLVGGWVPRFDDCMQTNRPGIFVAGDIAGVTGAKVAQEEGHLAGLFAATQLGLVAQRTATHQARPIRKRLRKLRKFHQALDEAAFIPREFFANMPDQTIICRCEEVTACEIRLAATEGTLDLSDIKKRTRAGMGYCQGAQCTSTIAAMLMAQFGVDPQRIKGITPRPPISPIPLSLLLVDNKSNNAKL